MLQLITNGKSYMGFQFVQKSITLNDLSQSACTVTSNQKLIRWRCNIWIMLVILKYLLCYRYMDSTYRYVKYVMAALQMIHDISVFSAK